METFNAHIKIGGLIWIHFPLVMVGIRIESEVKNDYQIFGIGKLHEQSWHCIRYRRQEKEQTARQQYDRSISNFFDMRTLAGIIQNTVWLKGHQRNQDWKYDFWNSTYNWDFPGVASGKEPPWQRRRHKRWGFYPCVRKIPWRRAGQPAPWFLPGASHGQRSLAVYRLWGLKCQTRFSD